MEFYIYLYVKETQPKLLQLEEIAKWKKCER